jgi:HK97 family phage prohead protease
VKNELERRVLFVSGMELRAAPAGSDSPGILRGYAAKWNNYSHDLGGFKERIKKGAFTRALAEGQDIRFLKNHDPNHVLGRVKAGTLSLAQDDMGLRFSCILPNTSVGSDLKTSVSRGDLDQCSFAFKVPSGGDSWGKDTDADGNEFVCRELQDVDLFDVSAVTYPAYEDTNVSVDSIGPLNVSSLQVSPRALMEARSLATRVPKQPRLMTSGTLSRHELFLRATSMAGRWTAEEYAESVKRFIEGRPKPNSHVTE